MIQKNFTIGKKKVGRGYPCFVVAEIGMAHDGSFKRAIRFIDAVAKTGVDAVKFQTHIAEAESTLQEPWRIQFNRRDKTRYDYWKRTQFTENEWRRLRHYAVKKGLIFLSSPFSEEAVQLLHRIGMPAWKIPSGEINNPFLMEAVIKTRKPVLLSTGMSPLQEIRKTIRCLKTAKVPFAVFQCSSFYPCPPEKLGLNLLNDFAGTFQCPVGLSDHSGKIYAGLAAATMGANLLEVHVTLDPKMKGPDTTSSLTPEKLGELVQGIRFIESVKNHPLRKDKMDKKLIRMRRIFNKSLVAKRDLSRGTVLNVSMLTAKKPGTGIPAANLNQVLKKVLKRDLAKDSFLRRQNLRSSR